jgi:hypothetical protein
MHRRALKADLALGLKHPNTLNSFDRLALVLRSLSHYQEVEVMHGQR